MKKQRKVTGARWLAVLVATVLVLAIASLPAFAMGVGGSGNNVGGQDKGFLGRTADSVESGLEGVESGAESIVDDIVDIPNGTDQNDTTDGTTDGTMDGTTDGNGGMNDGEGLLGDEVPEDGTNIPDTDIGGAVEDNDHDGIADGTDPDDDNDGVRDPVDTDADGDGVTDDNETTGMIGIVIAVIIVIAIIVLVIAVIPKARKK